MDLSNPKTWTDGLRVVVDAPHVVVPLLLAVAFGGWWFRGHLQDSQIGTLKQELALADRQLSDYRDKLAGASPDQVKARLVELEAKLTERVVRLEGRRLSPEQCAKIVASVKDTSAGRQYFVRVPAEIAADCEQYAEDFRLVLADAGWTAQTGSVFGVGRKPPSGIAIIFPDLNRPPLEALILMKALKAADIQFDAQQGSPNATAVEVLITTATKRLVSVPPLIT